MRKKQNSLFTSTDVEDSISISGNVNIPGGDIFGEDPNFTKNEKAQKAKVQDRNERRKTSKFFAPFIIFLNLILSRIGLSKQNAGAIKKEQLTPPHINLNRLQQKAHELGINLEKANDNEREYLYREIIFDIDSAINRSDLGKFTSAFIYRLKNDLEDIINGLTSPAWSNDKNITSIINRLRIAESELGVVIGFFDDSQEMDPIHRLVIRNKGILRLKNIFHDVIANWSSLIVPNQAAHNQHEPSKMKKLLAGGIDNSIQSRLPRAAGASRSYDSPVPAAATPQKDGWIRNIFSKLAGGITIDAPPPEKKKKPKGK